jgi:tetratricopeptide (TPR) repeat protein
MNPVWRHMAMSVFENQDIDLLTVEEIDQAIERYPYFAVLHFIRTGKLMAEEKTEAASSAARTALYFSNPHWLQYQLNRKVLHEDLDESLAEIMTTHTGTEIFDGLEEEIKLPEAEIEQEYQEGEYDSKRLYAQPEAKTETDEIELGGDEIVPAIEIEETEEEIIIDDIVPAVENTWEDETIPDEVVPSVENIWAETGSNAIPEETDIAEEDEAVPADELPPLEMKSVDFTPDDPGSALIPIEPLYTIDYFASQGIKLPVDEIPNDQLARKLKSFTEWLKSMKKLQPDKVDRQMDKDTENHIRTAAEHSNDSQELYTEALAEVYLKQGLDDKAIEVFKKLSLLDPSKSAYFAARIREIKEI